MRTRREKHIIAQDIAAQKHIAITFYCCGDQNNMDQLGIAYPNGTIKWYQVSACTFYGATKADKDYMKREREAYEQEIKSTEYMEYCGADLKKYVY